MRLLALDFEIWQQLRPRYGYALCILPIGLMFTAFLPLWSIAMALATRFGIPDGVPVKDQENGWLWLTIVLSIMVVLMITGYLLGFVLNAIILRFAFGWQNDRLRALFLFSAPPNSWLKDANATRASGIASPSAKDSWAVVRSKGMWHFVLRRGVLSWGVPMYLLMACGPALFGIPYRTEPTLFYWIWQAGLWTVASALFALAVWSLSERQHRKQHEKQP